MSELASESDSAVITADAVRELLADPKLLAELPAELDDDTEFTLDSLALVWLLHLVEQRHGLVVEPSDDTYTAFRSVRGITEELRRAAGPR